MDVALDSFLSNIRHCLYKKLWFAERNQLQVDVSHQDDTEQREIL